MRIAVLGTGVVGRVWAERLVELGHDIVIGTRDPDAHRGEGAPPLRTQAQAVMGADLVVNALNGQATLAVLSPLADALAGVVVMDISNPLDFSAGFPPSLFVSGSDSLGEQVQRALPRARVVKTMNTLTASLQVHPERNPGTVFVSGDDAEAKVVVVGLLTDVGHSDIVDLGDITGSRATESFLPLWLRLMGALGTAEFQIKVSRPVPE
ncbi:MAG: NAD(P)-binding domain-containing protein [Propionicimonas sp.]